MDTHKSDKNSVVKSLMLYFRAFTAPLKSISSSIMRSSFNPKESSFYPWHMLSMDDLKAEFTEFSPLSRIDRPLCLLRLLDGMTKVSLKFNRETSFMSDS